MNIKSILASLALVTATSTVAMADARDHRSNNRDNDRDDSTVIVRDHRTAPAPIVIKPVVQSTMIRDHRVERDDNDEWNRGHQPAQPKFIISHPTMRATWSDYAGNYAPYRGDELVTQPTQIGNSLEQFAIGAPKGRFNTLQLQGVVGSSDITKVAIVFVDGSIQTITPNRELDAGRTLSYDLAGSNRTIQRVLVWGDTNSGGAFQLALLK